MISESQEDGQNIVIRSSTYTYNVNQRLTSASVSRYEDSQLIEIGTAYRYNVSGIRTEAKQTSLSIDNVAQSTLTTRHFLIDAHNPTGYAQVLEETAALGGAPVKTYTLGDDVLSQTTASSTRYLLSDGHGSTRALADNNETITTSYDYDAYGQKLGSAFTLANSPATDLLYTGEQFDPDLQQYYLRARYYNPAIGRFNRLDPFAGNNHDPQSLHKYAYVHGDPVNSWDPTGKFTLGGVLVGASMAAGVRDTYNGVVLAVGDAVMITVLGMQAGMTANQIFATFLVGQALGFVGGFAIGKALSAAGAIARSASRYNGGNASKLMGRILQSHQNAGVRMTARQYASLSTKQIRSLPGIVFGGQGSLNAGAGQWLQQGGRWGTVPQNVATRLRGRQFSSFNQFRKAFWQEVAGDPQLAGQFVSNNTSRMRKGLAPIAPASEHSGSHSSYVLHHMQPLQRGGGLYDLDNILIVTPAEHQRILPRGYHFGS